MKKMTIGVFDSRENAAEAINKIHNAAGVSLDDISYIYRNTEGETREVDAAAVSSKTGEEGAATGATAGAWIGGIIGAAVAAGILPFAGPIFAAGPVLAYLGVTGAVGTTAAGAIGGAAVGGLIGWLADFGVGKERAVEYQDRVRAGDILVAAYAEESDATEAAMRESGATEIDTYAPAV